MKNVLVIDTSILCVWLQVPGKTECGEESDRWDFTRVRDYICTAEMKKTTFVLPLAAIIETGNHISQAPNSRYELAQNLCKVISAAVEQSSPWAAFTEQSDMWCKERLNDLANEWPTFAAEQLSIGDYTIKQVAEFYAQIGCNVEILTGDAGLKSYQPSIKPPVPRRRGNSRN